MSSQIDVILNPKKKKKEKKNEALGLATFK